ncbi:hypothetical protein BDR26DRAFT_869770 [Obelidium mucronatum]|nr:hypothetical protein BDR26DRAFT_869770 [Obelidium mucronatum]
MQLLAILATLATFANLAAAFNLGEVKTVPAECTIDTGAQGLWDSNKVVPSVGAVVEDTNDQFVTLPLTVANADQTIKVEGSCFTPTFDGCKLKLTPISGCSGVKTLTVTSSIGGSSTKQPVTLTITPSATNVDAKVSNPTLLEAIPCIITSFVVDPDTSSIKVQCGPNNPQLNFCQEDITASTATVFGSCTTKAATDITLTLGGFGTTTQYKIRSYNGDATNAATTTTTFSYKRADDRTGELNDVVLSVTDPNYATLQTPRTYSVNADPLDYIYFKLTSGFIPAKISSWRVDRQTNAGDWMDGFLSSPTASNCMTYANSGTAKDLLRFKLAVKTELLNGANQDCGFVSGDYKSYKLTVNWDVVGDNPQRRDTVKTATSGSASAVFKIDAPATGTSKPATVTVTNLVSSGHGIGEAVAAGAMLGAAFIL